MCVSHLLNISLPMATVLNSTVFKKMFFLHSLQHYQCLGFPQASLFTPVVSVLTLNNFHFYSQKINLSLGQLYGRLTMLSSPGVTPVLPSYPAWLHLWPSMSLVTPSQSFLVPLGPYLQMVGSSESGSGFFFVTFSPQEIRHLFWEKELLSRNSFHLR